MGRIVDGGRLVMPLRAVTKTRYLENTETLQRMTMEDPKLIRVWRYYDAPPEFQAMSRHGGDEDWLAVIPAGEDVPMWMESGERGFFAICELQVTELPDGRKVCIGAHA